MLIDNISQMIPNLIKKVLFYIRLFKRSIGSVRLMWVDRYRL